MAARKRKEYVPSMSDAAVKARTGRDWNAWFGALDKEGAAKLDHKAIVRILAAKHSLPSWWCQMLTVEYERARGLRVPHETKRGFSVAVSKTVATSLADLYAAAANDATRRKWFPKGAFELSSQTRDKYFRGSWNSSSRLEMGFYAKGNGRAQIAVGVNKLARKADVERQRQTWKAALTRLQAIIEE